MFLKSPRNVIARKPLDILSLSKDTGLRHLIIGLRNRFMGDMC